MINSINNNISFGKTLTAKANIIRNNRPETCNIYHLEQDNQEDKGYFKKLIESQQWKGFNFISIFDVKMNEVQTGNDIYVLEDKKNDCLGVVEIGDKSFCGEYLNIFYLETRPDCANRNDSRNAKYIGETLLSFATKMAEKKDKDGLIIMHPVLDAEKYYTKHCGFERIQKSSRILVLGTDKFKNLVNRNQYHTKGKIEVIA